VAADEAAKSAAEPAATPAAAEPAAAEPAATPAAVPARDEARDERYRKALDEMAGPSWKASHHAQDRAEVKEREKRAELEALARQPTFFFDDTTSLWHGRQVPPMVVKKSIEDGMLVGHRLLVTIGTKMCEAAMSMADQQRLAEAPNAPPTKPLEPASPSAPTPILTGCIPSAAPPTPTRPPGAEVRTPSFGPAIEVDDDEAETLLRKTPVKWLATKFDLIAAMVSQKEKEKAIRSLYDLSSFVKAETSKLRPKLDKPDLTFSGEGSQDEKSEAWKVARKELIRWRSLYPEASDELMGTYVIRAITGYARSWLEHKIGDETSFAHMMSMMDDRYYCSRVLQEFEDARTYREHVRGKGETMERFLEDHLALRDIYLRSGFSEDSSAGYQLLQAMSLKPKELTETMLQIAQDPRSEGSSGETPAFDIVLKTLKVRAMAERMQLQMSGKTVQQAFVSTGQVRGRSRSRTRRKRDRSQTPARHGDAPKAPDLAVPHTEAPAPHDALLAKGKGKGAQNRSLTPPGGRMCRFGTNCKYITQPHPKSGEKCHFRHPGQQVPQVQPSNRPPKEKCTHCQKEGHGVDKCFAKHPELLEAYRAKRSRIAQPR